METIKYHTIEEWKKAKEEEAKLAKRRFESNEDIKFSVPPQPRKYFYPRSTDYFSMLGRVAKAAFFAIFGTAFFCMIPGALIGFYYKDITIFWVSIAATGIPLFAWALLIAFPARVYYGIIEGKSLLGALRYGEKSDDYMSIWFFRPPSYFDMRHRLKMFKK